MHTETRAPIALPHEAGETVRVIDDLITFKARAVDTGGAFSLFDVRTAPGGGTPPHIHALEEESFFILDGTYTFLLGDAYETFGPGAFVLVPRGTVHCFRNTGDTTARMLVIASPGGIIEQFFREVGEAPDAPMPEGGPDVARLVAAAGKYGVTILPPA